MSLFYMVNPVENIDVEHPHIRKAVLWGQDDLLTQSINLFLEENLTWEVIRVSKDGGIDDLIEEMQRIKPEVVILCEDSLDEKSILPLQLMNEQICLKVISIGLENNLTQVYSKQNIILHGVPDLLSIVETGNFQTAHLERRCDQ